MLSTITNYSQMKRFPFNVCNKKSRCLSRLTFVFLKIYCMQADCPFLNLPETGKWKLETRGNSFSFCKVSLVWCFTSSCDKCYFESLKNKFIPKTGCTQHSLPSKCVLHLYSMSAGSIRSHKCWTRSLLNTFMVPCDSKHMKLELGFQYNLWRHVKDLSTSRVMASMVF